jgi:hypothetical protein
LVCKHCSWFHSRRLYAGNNLDKARRLFAEAIKHRPKIPADNSAADAGAAAVAAMKNASGELALKGQLIQVATSQYH